MDDHEPAPEYALDELAERQCLGITISAPELAHETFLRLTAVGAWTNDRRVIAAGIGDLYAAEEPVTPQTVQRIVETRAGTDELAHRMTMQVFSVWQETSHADAESLRYWAERAYRVARGRTAMLAALTLRQKVDESLRNDDPLQYDRALAEVTAAIELAATPLDHVVAPPMNYPALAAVPSAHNWLIPGLFERGDRLILTGFEGLGKTELMIQMACTSAAGLHMFSGRPLALAGGGPLTVLVIDGENSMRQLARRYRKVGGLVENLCDHHDVPRPPWRDEDDGSLRFVIRPEGIPLSNGRELARLERSIAATAPDLVVAGPHYKLTGARDTRDEQEAAIVTAELDELRVRYGFALILEAHSPHPVAGRQRDLRPVGSSLFLRWPEFGYGIRAAEGCEDEEYPSTIKFEPWRGPRDIRAWPRALSRMRSLPWMPYGPYSDWLDTGGEQVA